MPKLSLKNVCNEKMYNELFKAHSKDLFNFLYYKYGADNNPGDLVQEAFLKLWKNCHKVLPEKARSFLFTVAINQVLNDLAKKKTVMKYAEEKIILQKPEIHDSLSEEEARMGQLQKAIQELTEDQRVTLLLNRIEGKKHQEIADMLGISRKAVEKRIYTALTILKEKVGKI